MLVLDEADRMLDMGFRPTIRRIVAALSKERQTMCFSATMEGDAARLVKDYTKNPVRLTLGSTLKPSENVRLQALEVAAEAKPQALRRLLKSETGQCLVFARTKRGSERVASQLNREGIQATVIHGDRSQSERTAALKAFQQGAEFSWRPIPPSCVDLGRICRRRCSNLPNLPQQQTNN